MTSMDYKIISLLLSYPGAAFQAAAGEMAEALQTRSRLSPPRRAALIAMIAAMAEEDLFDLQAAYVDLFDRSRTLSLHLFEHVHGESRDRGQAMVSLRERYQAAGLDIASSELPDYLPLFLEFLSRQDGAAAKAMLGETVHILQALAERLAKRGSRYALVFEALQDLAAARPDPAALNQLRETAVDDPDDLRALDAAWEEAEVRFGPGDATAESCPRADDMLRRMQAPKIALGEGA